MVVTIHQTGVLEMRISAIIDIQTSTCWRNPLLLLRGNDLKSISQEMVVIGN